MQAPGSHLSASSSCCSGLERQLPRCVSGRTQQAALCGESVCFQRRGRSHRSKATAILDSAVLSREDTRAQEQRSAGPKGIKNNAVELVGNTPMVSLVLCFAAHGGRCKGMPHDDENCRMHQLSASLCHWRYVSLEYQQDFFLL